MRCLCFVRLVLPVRFKGTIPRGVYLMNKRCCLGFGWFQGGVEDLVSWVQCFGVLETSHQISRDGIFVFR